MLHVWQGLECPYFDAAKLNYLNNIVHIRGCAIFQWDFQCRCTFIWEHVVFGLYLYVGVICLWDSKFKMLKNPIVDPTF